MENTVAASDLEAGLLGNNAAAARRAQRRGAAAPSRFSPKDLASNSGLPALFLYILAEAAGPAIRFPIGADLWWDFCTFLLVFFLFTFTFTAMILAITSVSAAGQTNSNPCMLVGRVLAVWLALMYLFCHSFAPQHLGLFFSSAATWFSAPLQLYQDYHASDTAYVCNPQFGFQCGALMSQCTPEFALTPPYQNGFQCGALMNPFAQHWRPVVWGLFSWMTVVKFAWIWPEIASRIPGLEDRQCLARVLFFPAFPFLMICDLTNGMLYTCALARVAWVYLLQVFERIYHVYLGDGGDAVEVTDVLAVLLVGWWFLALSRQSGLQHFNSMATSSHVQDAFNHESFHAKIKQSDTLSLMHRTTSQMLTGKTDTKNLKQIRKELIEDAKTAAVEKLATADKGKKMPPAFVLSGIRREHILEDSFSKLKEANTFELLADKFMVSFKGEQGIDAGGVTRDWFDKLAQSMAHDADEKGKTCRALFTLTTDGTLMPRNTGLDDDAKAIPDELKPVLDNLYTAGRFLALAVLKEHPLPLAFGSVLMKTVCDEYIDYSDVRRLDPDFYRIRVEMVMKEGGVAEMNSALGEDLTFMSAAEETVEAKPLKEGGAAIKVTEENKKEYVMRLCEAHLCNGIRKELAVFLAGFHEVLDLETLKGMEVTHSDLSLLISGVASLDVEDWKRHCKAEGPPQIVQWFWEVVGEFDDEKKARLLQFSTGSSRVPPGGFKDLEPAFKITVTSESGEHLPHTHTCFNQLMLAKYESKEQLETKVTAAVNMAQGFAFA